MPEETNPIDAPQTAAPSHVVWAVEHPQALARVILGLTLVFWGLCGTLLALVALPVLAIAGEISGAKIDQFLRYAFGFASVTLCLRLVILTGESLCLAAPREAGGRPFAITAVVLHGVVLALGLFQLGAFQPENSVSALGVSFAISGFNLAGLVSFMLFMRLVAQYLVRHDIVRRGKWILIVGGVAALLLGGAVAGTRFVPAEAITICRIAMLVGAILALVALIMYANMVTYLRKAITV